MPILNRRTKELLNQLAQELGKEFDAELARRVKAAKRPAPKKSRARKPRK